MRLKTWQKFNESKNSEGFVNYYKQEVVDKCDDIIQDIEIMLLEFKDVGFFVTVGYTPMTLVLRESSPKIIVEVQANKELYDSKKGDVISAFERIKEYVKSKGFVTGQNSWTRDDITHFQMLIQ